MHDRVDLIEKIRWKLPDVAEDLAIEKRFRENARASHTVAKEPCKDGAHISHVARNQNAHSSSLQILSPNFPRRLAGAAAIFEGRLSTIGCSSYGMGFHTCRPKGQPGDQRWRVGAFDANRVTQVRRTIEALRFGA